jgi:hypothetical protein
MHLSLLKVVAKTSEHFEIHGTQSVLGRCNLGGAEHFPLMVASVLVMVSRVRI